MYELQRFAKCFAGFRVQILQVGRLCVPALIGTVSWRDGKVCLLLEPLEFVHGDTSCSVVNGIWGFPKRVAPWRFCARRIPGCGSIYESIETSVHYQGLRLRFYCK
mmetsp:Transcript_40686/g.161291  ORF Transcript_40686/g.161291 Transcript_40686/m.161291 type:complete len:106 (+) Transcript_40686:175-492(+)